VLSVGECFQGFATYIALVLAVVLLLFGASLMGFGHLKWYIHIDLAVCALGTALSMVSGLMM
jgi:general stress protein CsbA